MPSIKKKLVRSRMAKTGESYQAALRHVRPIDDVPQKYKAVRNKLSASQSAILAYLAPFRPKNAVRVANDAGYTLEWGPNDRLLFRTPDGRESNVAHANIVEVPGNPIETWTKRDVAALGELLSSLKLELETQTEDARIRAERRALYLERLRLLRPVGEKLGLRLTKIDRLVEEGKEYRALELLIHHIHRTLEASFPYELVGGAFGSDRVEVRIGGVVLWWTGHVISVHPEGDPTYQSNKCLHVYESWSIPQLEIVAQGFDALYEKLTEKANRCRPEFIEQTKQLETFADILGGVIGKVGIDPTLRYQASVPSKDDDWSL